MRKRRLKETSPEKRTTLIKRFIEASKWFLPKYWKNNVWSWAAWDSWAATGKVDGCRVCNNAYYNATLQNKRHIEPGSRFQSRIDISKLCNSCVCEIEEQLKVGFNRE